MLKREFELAFAMSIPGNEFEPSALYDAVSPAKMLYVSERPSTPNAKPNSSVICFDTSKLPTTWLKLNPPGLKRVGLDLPKPRLTVLATV